jgi:ubiquinone/menaquinone biosynthesis C-methylase UbiE
MKGHRWFAAVYDRVNRASERRIIGPLRATIAGSARGRVLEIGAGTGFSFPYYGRGADVIATDPDAYMLRRARERARRAGAAGRRILLAQAAAEALPFAGATFDAAVAAVVF